MRRFTHLTAGVTLLGASGVFSRVDKSGASHRRQPAAGRLVGSSASMLIAVTALWTASPNRIAAGRSEGVDLSVTVLTNSRVGRPGMATVVRSNGKTYFFDCRGIDAASAPALATENPTALFVTNPNWLTEPDVIRLLDDASGRSLPFRVWGPTGTRLWLQRRFPLGPGTGAQFGPAAADVAEGEVPEQGIHVTASSADDDTVAYRIEANGRSILVASTVPTPTLLTGLASQVDLVILRHSNSKATFRFLEHARPNQLWVVPDGLPLTDAQVRESYSGSFDMITATVVDRPVVASSAARSADRND